MDCSFCLVGGMAQYPTVEHRAATIGDLCSECAAYIARNNARADEADRQAEKAHGWTASVIRIARLGKRTCPVHGEVWHSVGATVAFCLPCVRRLDA